MKTNTNKGHLISGRGGRIALLCTALTLPLSFLQANNWQGSGGTGGNGSWGTGAQWSTGTSPNNTTNTTQNNADFFIDDTLTTANASVNFFSTPRSAYRIRVGSGKSVTFTLNTTVTLNSGAASVFGADIVGQTGTGASTTTFTPGAGSGILNLGMIYVGDEAGGDGHSLAFSGGDSGSLTVNDLSSFASIVGRQGRNSSLTVSEGADLIRNSLTIGGNTSYEGNRVIVTGVTSTVTVNTIGTSIGAAAYTGATAQERYDNGSRENRVIVENGGTYTSAGIKIGSADNARSNYVEVKGANSTMILSNNSQLNVGTENSLGGNYLEVSNGGVIRASGVTTIASHLNNSGLNDGNNRLIISDGGTFTSSSQINVSGLLQLDTGGVLAGQTATGDSASMTVNVQTGGRFEAAGSGLDNSVTTNVDGGIFAIGLQDIASGTRTEAAMLDLGSTLQFGNGGSLEISIFSAVSSDQINFASLGELSGTVFLQLVLQGYTPVEGDVWTIFTGDTSGITANFNFSGLDSSWDTSAFNEAGGWQLSVVPEPQIWMLLGSGLAVIVFAAWRKRTGSVS